MTDTFRPEATVKALARHIKDYQDKKIERELAKIPEELRAAFLFEQLGLGTLAEHYLITKATAERIHQVSKEQLAEALRGLSARSRAELLPEVGDQALFFLNHADLRDEGYLRGIEAELPLPARLAYWLARGRMNVKGEAPPEEIKAAAIAALPAHALSGRMRHHELGQVIQWLGIPLETIYAPTVEAIRKSKNKVRLPALGCPLFAMPFAELASLADRLDVRYVSAAYLRWWMEARREKLPEEPLEQSAEILGMLAKVVPRKIKEYERSTILAAIEGGALVLAHAAVEAKREVPEALIGTLGKHTRDLDPWLDILRALPQARQKEVLRRLSGVLEPHYRSALIPLELAAEGEEALPSLIDALEEGIRNANSVSVDHIFVPVGKIGAAVVGPLMRRIDERTAALDPADPPYSSGYKPRRVIHGLRNALAVALGEVLKGGGEVEDRAYSYLDPSPATLFEGNDDFPYSFLSGLAEAQALFEAMPEERARAFIAAWRASGTSYVEERLEHVIPNKRRALLADAPGLGEQIAQLVEESGLPATRPVYLLFTEGPGKKSSGLLTSPLMRLGGIPKGLPPERWPSDGTELYEPIFTLDLDLLPELRPLFPGARAICLLVDRPEEGFEGSEMMALSEAECAAGLEGGEPFWAEKVMVPEEVFADEVPQGPLSLIRRRINEAPARALGRPAFIQEEPHAGDDRGFVLQASERFGGLNLGDMGRLYVYAREAFWDCH